MSEVEVVREALNLLESETAYQGVAGDARIALDSLEAELAEAQVVLQSIRQECDDTGGEFWAGSNPEVWDRLVALTQEGAL